MFSPQLVGSLINRFLTKPQSCMKLAEKMLITFFTWDQIENIFLTVQKYQQEQQQCCQNAVMRRNNAHNASEGYMFKTLSVTTLKIRQS